jgi:hypothetical protein
METRLLKGYIVCRIKLKSRDTNYFTSLFIEGGMIHDTFEVAENHIPVQKNLETYTILPVYRRIKTQAK